MIVRGVFAGCGRGRVGRCEEGVGFERGVGGVERDYSAVCEACAFAKGGWRWFVWLALHGSNKRELKSQWTLTGCEAEGEEEEEEEDISSLGCSPDHLVLSHRLMLSGRYEYGRCSKVQSDV